MRQEIIRLVIRSSGKQQVNWVVTAMTLSFLWAAKHTSVQQPNLLELVYT